MVRAAHDPETHSPGADVDQVEGGHPLDRSRRRPRHYVGWQTFRLIRPALRYSASRDAYVLRGVGGRHGPVLRPGPTHARAPRTLG